LTGDLLVGGQGRIDELMKGAATGEAAGAAESVTRSAAYSQFFNEFVGANENGFALGGQGSKWLWIIALTFVLNFVLIYRGITKGIERFCRVAMPLMALLALIVLVRVLTLGTPDPANYPERSVVNGLGFMWNPNPEKLWDPQTWLAASGQIFFSLSVGFGIIVNYASYLRRNDDVVLSGLTSSSVNEFFEVCLGGLITIPAAFIFLGALEAGTLESSFALGFRTLPNVFSAMWGGQLFGFLWFFMLFLAAITSSVSMLQPVIAFLEEGAGLKRHFSVTFLGLIAALGTGFVLYFSKGLTALDTFDFWVGTFFIFMLSMFQAVLYGWVLGIDRGEQEAHVGAHLRIPRFVQYVLKYVTPVYLGVIFVLFCYFNLPSSETEKFTIVSPAAQRVEAGEVTAELRDEFSREGVELSEEATLEQSEDGVWKLAPEAGAPPAYILRETTNATGGSILAVNARVPGKIELMLRNPAAILSVMFLGVVLAFLLFMTYIAGRRWEREGRFRAAVAPPA
jgi:NSS family neurotransmitter:Na+ symporter